MPIVARSPDVRLALPPAPAAAHRARHALRRAGVSPDLEHTVALLTTELVTNSVKHAGLDDEDRIVLVAVVSGDYVRVEVHDGGPGFDPDVRHSAEGFGLRLLETLATDWGVRRRGGCSVWFELDKRRRRFDRL